MYGVQNIQVVPALQARFHRWQVRRVVYTVKFHCKSIQNLVEIFSRSIRALIDLCNQSKTLRKR
ncbi:MAG: hypothetical protein DKT66_14735 [Candidatus Melainabacteria bacterium]|nr:MAG: hypothetical protein DKT66_14735 [Candidatus Melainabacteria bacterium]